MNMRILGFSAALGLLGISSCGEVESCRQGVDPGCVDSQPDDSNNCKFGLVLGAEGTCVEPKNANTVADAGPEPGGNCSCPSGNACGRAGTCIDVCATPNNIPNFKPKPTCRAPMGENPYTFEQAAIAACTVQCIRRNEFCGASCDPAADCTPARALLAVPALGICMTQTQGTPVECASRACEMLRDRPCEMQECAGAAQPLCAGVQCTNTCAVGSMSYSGDGYCDDGDQSNADSAICAWGTDCQDCGPRGTRSTPPLALYEYGQFCVDSLQCGEFSADFNRSTGWCVTFSNAPQRCLPDCTKSRRCAAGFTCQVLELEPGVAYEDNAGVEARFCRPNACTQ
jgi:hypothetical protein